MKYFRKNDGITLIALVITIIVMLILVAVTIRIAVNGKLFGYAGKATLDTQNAMKTENEILDEKITVNGTTYNSIDEYITKWGDNGADDENEIFLGEAKNVENYGEKVNYTSKKENLTWRLFYQDENFAYLISETTDGTNAKYPGSSFAFYTDNVGGSKKSIVEKYHSGDDVSKEGRALMTLAADLFTGSNENENIIATAYMCDTSENGPWKDYLDEKDASRK